MKPFYDEGGITIYHGDCREVLLGKCGPADVVITDPPYNVGKRYGGHDDRQDLAAYEAWLADVLTLCAGLAPEVVFFPGMVNVTRVGSVLAETPLRVHRTLGWHKREYAGDKWNGGPAMCWDPIVWATRSDKPAFNKLFGGRGRDFLAVNSTHGDPAAKWHPCPKPVEVLQWLIGLFVPEGGKVLDPFMGSGSTLKAAQDLDRHAVGIELEEEFCRRTVLDRLGQGVLRPEVVA